MKYIYFVKRRFETVFLLLTLLCTQGWAQNISTIAGIGTSSFSGDGGLATSAELAQPVSVARDASGNIYISDQGNHRIRKITLSTGNISTVAGSSTAGFSGDGSAATSAKLYYPSGIAVDGSGNIYIADQSNQRIRKVTASTGIISTVAGTGTAGFSGDGSAATAAQLNNPVSVAVDGSGNIYIADQYNQRIRKVTAATGNISTIAGTGTYSYTGDGGAATSATFQNPAGLKLDASGNIYIADLFNHAVRKITVSTGYISTVAGTGSAGYSGDGSAATAAKLNYPTDVSLDDSNNLYIAVQYSHRVRKVSAATGDISTLVGTGTAGYSGDGGLSTLAQINYPTGLATDAGGNIYLADRENHRIRFICNYTVIPTVSTPVSYCLGATASALSATGPSLKWYTTPSGGLGSSTAPTPSTATAGTTTYYVASISPYGCEGPRDSIKVTVNALPTAPVVTTPVTYCVGATASALSATGTSLKWYTSATGGVALSTAPTPSTTSAGTTNYYVAQTNTTTGCEGPRATISVVVNALPIAPTATTSISYCEGATASALTATGTALKWYTVASGGTALSAAPTPSTTSAGTTTYYVSQTTSCGESSRTAITVTINALPAAPTLSSPVEYCQYATASALTATGTSLKWYTTATGGVGSSTAYTPSTSSAGTTSYYVSQTNTSTGCESSRATIVVTINAAPSAPSVTSPVTYCIGATTSALTATGTSLNWYTTATGGTASATAPTPSSTSAGTTTYYVSQTSSSTGCESSRASISVTVYALPSAPAVTSPVNYCEGATASALTASGTSLKWYTVASGGTALGTAPTPSTSSTGSTTYYVSQTSGSSCEGTRASIVVNVTALPSAPTVTSPITYCQGATASALTATGASLKWYTVASGGTALSAAPSPSTATSGTTTYYVSQTSSGCEGTRASIVVTINPKPTAPTVTTPVTYCVGATASALSATGTTLLWYTTATGGSSSAIAPTPSTTSAGTTTYYVSQTTALGCEGPRAAIAVVVNPLPTAPTATTPINYCEGATASALTASGTSLTWYTVASGGSGSSSAPTPTTTTTGTTTYYVSQTTSCGESARTAIVVNVNPVPAAPTVVSPIEYCQGDTGVAALSASGTSLKWYTSATGGTGSSTAPTPSTATAGTTTYYVSQTNASGCESPRSAIVVNIKTAPAAPTVTSPINYCVGATASPLSATGVGLLWYTVPYGGTGSSTAPTPNTTTAGSTTYYVSQTDTSSCPSLRASITVNVHAVPVAPTVTHTVSYCQGATTSALTASASGGDTLKWYTVAVGGTPSLTAPTPSSATSGTSVYYVSATSRYGCGESARDSITVTINAKPSPPTVVSPVNYCQFDTATALSVTGTSLKWYLSSTGGTATSTTPTPSTSGVGILRYFVSQSILGCESNRDSIIVNINAIPAAPTVTTPLSYCVGATATALSASGSSLKWYTIATGGSSSTTAPTPSTVSTGATSYYVSQTSAAGCESPRATIVVNVSTATSPPTVTSPISYCQGATATALSASGSSLLWYTTASGGTGSSTAPTPVTTSAGTDTFYVSQTITLGGCGESARAAIAVVTKPLSAAPMAVDTVEYCQGATASALSATGTSLQWYTVATGGSATTTAPTPSTTTAGTTIYYVSQTASGSCEGARDSIMVIVHAKPSAPTVSTPVQYCLGATPTALSATGTSLNWYTVASGGTSSTTAPTPSTLSAGTTNYYVSQTSVDGCEGNRANIAVVVNALPSAPTVTSPVTYCVGETAIALTATGTSLKWYTVATGGTGTATAPTPTTTIADSTTYYVSQTNAASCEGLRSAIVVKVNPLPTAPSVAFDTISYCSGATASALSATGTSLKWYTVATGGTSTTTAPTPITTTAGTKIYYVCQTSALGCEGPRTPIVVIINATPSAPTVSSPVEYCSGVTATALSATGTSLKWYATASSSGASTTAPTPSTSSTGASSYFVSQTSAAGCESPRSEISVIVYATPSAPTVGFLVTLCLGTPAGPLTATGSGLKWYTAATGGVGSSTAPSPPTSTTGAIYYYVSQTSSSGCEGPRAAILVTIDTLLDAPIVTSPVVYCEGSTATALSATGAGLRWYEGSPTGTYTTTVPTPSTASAGTTKYYVSGVSTAGCEGFKDSITVVVNPLPTAPVVSSPITYCVGSTASALSATGTSLKWYTVATGGTSSATAPTPSTASAGTTTYYVSQTSTDGCEGPRASIAVVVNALPGLPSVTSPVTYCQNATAAALTATGTSLKWYSSATGGTGLSTAPTPSTASAGTTKYYVSQTSTDGCEGPRDSISVVVNPLPAKPTVVSPVTYCIGETAAALTATGTSLKWYTSATGGTSSSTAPTPNTSVASTTTYYVSQTSTDACEGPRDSITVIINAVLPAPIVTSPVSYCIGATASALTATGSSLRWYTTATGGTASITAPTPITSSTGTVTYYVSQTTTAGCEGLRASIAVVVNPLPGVPTVTSPVTYCQNAIASALTATGTSLKWYTSATGGTGTSTAPTPSTTSAGTTKYYVSQTSTDGCEGTRDSISVVVNPIPAKPMVVSPVTYCIGETASALTATGTSLKWYTSATGGTGTSTAPTPNTSVASTMTYYVSQTTTAGCEGPRDSIAVIINAVLPAPTVTSPVSYCIGATASALTATGTSLKWYTSATGGTASTTAPTPSTSSTGTVTYYVSQTTTSGCEGLRASIAVVVNPLPGVPVVTSPVTYCQNAMAAALTATGTGLKWYSSATGGTGLSTAPTPSTTSAGTTKYYVSQTSTDGCEGPRDSISVVVNPIPAKPIVVSPVTYCIGETAAALTATGTSLKWYTSPTSSTGTSTAPTPSTASSGTVTYYVSQTSTDGCEGPRDSINVIVNSVLPAPTVTSPVSYCIGATASTLTATGFSLKWYTSATGGTGSTTAPTPSTSSTGTVTYYVSQTTTSGCEGLRASIAVVVNPLPGVPSITSPVTYCQNATAAALTATGTGLKWYSSATGGTGLSTAPTPSTASAGTTKYYVSQTSTDGCEGPRDSISVVVNPIPAKPAVVSPVTYCQAATASALTATGTSLKWYTAAAGGTGTSTAPTPSTASSGTTTYYVSQTSTYGCEGPRDSIQVTVNPLPSAPVVSSPLTYCVGVTASALTATGTSLKWYTSATGGTGSSTAPTPSTASSGTTIYYVSQTSGASCEGPRVSISVVVNPLPAAPTVSSPVTYCQAATAAALTATGTGLKWYSSATGGTGSSTAPTPSTASAGTTTYYVSQTSTDGCEGPRASLSVVVNPMPAKPTVVSPVIYCQSATAAALSATGTSLKWYTSATGGTGTSTAPTPSTASAGTTTYYVSQTSTYGCEGPRDSIKVKVNPLPLAPVVVSPIGYCLGSIAPALTATGILLKWYTSATGGAGSGTAPTPSTAIAGTTTYYVSQTSTDGCEGPRASIMVEITDKPDVKIVPVGSPMFVYCKNDTVVLKANSSVTIYSYQWYRNGVLMPGATSDTYKAFSNGDYKVEVTNIYGCLKDTSVYVFQDTLPDPILSPTSLQFCPNVSIILFCTPGSLRYTYEWYKDAVFVPGTSGSQLIITKAGDYYVRVTDSFGCVTLTNHSIATTYPAVPKPTIIRRDPLLTLSRSYVAYQWFRNGKAIAGANSINYTWSVNGKYWCEVTDGNDCTALSDTIDTELLNAIKTAQLTEANIKIYPNPTKAKIYIEAPFAINIVVTDATGRMVLKQSDAKEIDLYPYADGVYIFTLMSEEGEILGVERINKLSGNY